MKNTSIMAENGPVIYGLEFQSRALCAQTAEHDAIRFLVGTQSLKFSTNQVHLIELNEETGNLKTQIFQHSIGEIWSLQSSPNSPDKLITCYNALNDEGKCEMQGAIWKLPALKNTYDIVPLELISKIDTTPYGSDLRTILYHPTQEEKAVAIVDNNFVLWDLVSSPEVVTVGTLTSKGQPKFTNGRWNPHNTNQFVTLNDNNVRGWDFRTPKDTAWAIMSAHSEIVRDLDFNSNRQYILSTCGDDGYMKFWDVRNPEEPLSSKMEHSHWVWSIRINHFHDQLVLTSGSDCRVILCSAASISSEPYGHTILDNENLGENTEQVGSKEKLEDGLIAKYEEHEDSVYVAEWSSADPWTFASLSYDGRLVLNKVPRKFKYQILL